MIRNAIYFGLWAIFCMALAIAGFFVAFGGLPHTINGVRETVPIITDFAIFSPVAGVMAAVGWWLLHRTIAHPIWWGYALLAIGVVVVSHLLVFGSLGIGWFWPHLSDFAVILGLEFMMHGWLSVPVALVATALFVLWNHRRAAA